MELQAVAGLVERDAGRLRLAEILHREALGDGDEASKLDRSADLPNREGYAALVENAFESPTQAPLSTFSVDVDTASYANVRRLLREGRLPPPDAVRLEELVNYFRYTYAQPTLDVPFAVDVAVGAAPWAPTHRLVRLALQGRVTHPLERPAANLVFLVDVSGSMDEPDKLPLLVQGLQMLVRELDARDRVALVVYAGASGLVLDSTSCAEGTAITQALERLSAGGSTNGGAGIELAYDVAKRHFVEGGINRVLLATDGDFNVGVSDDGSLTRLIEAKAKSGVFLTVLGFGTGNLQDAKMEALADHGNGTYAYVDSVLEARKVLVEELGATLETIAKDVKVQVEFNPAEVAAYRLLGYENRKLAARDFNDDTRDAGEIGAGHTVTALYEVVPVGVEVPKASVDPLRYQTPTQVSGAAYSGELLTVKLRYKAPDGETSKLIERVVRDERRGFDELDADTRFAAAVAAYGMLLRGSAYAGNASWDRVLAWAGAALGEDPGGYRAEFLELVRRANELDPHGLDPRGADWRERLKQLGYLLDEDEAGDGDR
ncbi:MAG: VWA domain-containing protein [Planctomycetes bacterium]|nr:VWA domain-containing protein [Planctomycetota bacterium]